MREAKQMISPVAWRGAAPEPSVVVEEGPSVPGSMVVSAAADCTAETTTQTIAKTNRYFMVGLKLSLVQSKN
jgi:hypothetical protein